MIIFSLERNWVGRGTFAMQYCVQSVLLTVFSLKGSAVFPTFFFFVLCSGAGISPGLLFACVKSPVLIAIIYVTILTVGCWVLSREFSQWDSLDFPGLTQYHLFHFVFPGTTFSVFCFECIISKIFNTTGLTEAYFSLHSCWRNACPYILQYVRSPTYTCPVPSALLQAMKMKRDTEQRLAGKMNVNKWWNCQLMETEAIMVLVLLQVY